jgi:hypothetical protein
VKNWFQAFAFKWVNLCRYTLELPPHVLARVRELAAQKGSPRGGGGGARGRAIEAGNNGSGGNGSGGNANGSNGSNALALAASGAGSDSASASASANALVVVGGSGGNGMGGAGGVAPPGAPKGARRSKHHSPWTLGESRALVDGVDQCGGCRWTVIKKLGLTSLVGGLHKLNVDPNHTRCAYALLKLYKPH